MKAYKKHKKLVAVFWNILLLRYRVQGPSNYAKKIYNRFLFEMGGEIVDIIRCTPVAKWDDIRVLRENHLQDSYEKFGLNAKYFRQVYDWQQHVHRSNCIVR